jgi:tRNA threonylcarbamoyladenosine biosynthesis protein TsaB
VHEVLGRGHAERLVPMIAGLPEKGRADTILVSLGPGSFTGVRIGIATARALGFAWQAEVLGYPTLALVASMARADDAQGPVTVCMNGGHGEWFVQDFDAAGMPQDEVASLAPAAAAARNLHATVGGDRAAELIGDGSDAKHRAVDILPDARATPLLPKTLLTQDLAPIYGRGPDATPSALAEAVR